MRWPHKGLRKGYGSNRRVREELETHRQGSRNMERSRKQPYFRTPISSRFWDKIDKCCPNDCWEWTMGSTPKGYGQIRDSGRTLLAHRVSWALAHGPIPAGLCVLHHCDNPPCVNPTHLFLGTRTDNARDCGRKGRRPKGSAHGRAKLTEADVRMIRTSDEKTSVLAKRLGVDRTTVGYARRGRTWQHVDGASA